MLTQPTWPPQYALRAGGDFVPLYFWTPHLGRFLGGARSGTADNYGGTLKPTSGGIAIDNANKTLDENWAISEATRFPLMVAGSFICRATTANETAVGIGDSATVGGGKYGRVGQTTSGFIGGGISTDIGNPEGVIDGPAAVVGKQYNAVYISRSVIDHTLWINGAKYTSSTHKVGVTGSYGNFTVGAVNRVTTRVFRGTQDVLQAFFHIGSDPGDGWLQRWSINPNIVFAPRERRLWAPAGGGGSSIAPISAYRRMMERA